MGSIQCPELVGLFFILNKKPINFSVQVKQQTSKPFFCELSPAMLTAKQVLTLVLLMTWLALTITCEAREDHASPKCRCFPGDPCWPLEWSWKKLNTSLGGRLIATTPIASVCHESQFGAYDSSACAQLQAAWNDPRTHYTSPSSPMAHYFANKSCDPFTPPHSQCVLGTYVQYSVNASSARHFQVALEFAKRENIRLVIRNTGHDYYGKSTGAGALAIWTHNMKKISVHEYRSPYYTGKVVKISAGVSNAEAQEAAHRHGLIIAGGVSSSVGASGGWSQGGGHGPLASFLGLGADQVIEWEVVTGAGQHLIATPREHQDLFWAIAGGGGGTFGIVVSVTLRAYPDVKVAAANLTFTDRGVSSETFYGAVHKFLTTLPGVTDSNGTGVWLLQQGVFSLFPAVAPNMTAVQLDTILQPILDRLDADGIMHGKHPASVSSQLVVRKLITRRLCNPGVPNLFRQLSNYGY